jgi:hypothetical protein
LLVSHLMKPSHIIKSTNIRFGCQRMPKDIKKQKTRVSTGLEAGIWTLPDVVEHVGGGDRWT